MTNQIGVVEVRQIQEELASSDVDVVAVLRKCKILARRLHSDQFAQWVDWELNGYPKDAEVPEYRTVHPVHYASFSNGYWSVQQQPISTFLIDKEWRHLFEPFPYRAGITAVKTLAATKGGAMFERNEFRFLLKNKVVDLPCHQFWSQISDVELKQIISAVTNRLLDFIMDIEAENPNAGEAPASDIPVSPEKVQRLVQNYFHGPVGNIAQHSSGFSQTATLNVDQVRELVATIRSDLAAVPQLEPATRASADAQLATIDAQLAAPTPNEGIVREAGRSLRTIVEGAIAGAVVQPGVWQAIVGSMKSLFGP
jgi:AbiTii-like protein